MKLVLFAILALVSIIVVVARFPVLLSFGFEITSNENRQVKLAIPARKYLFPRQIVTKGPAFLGAPFSDPHIHVTGFGETEIDGTKFAVQTARINPAFDSMYRREVVSLKSGGKQLNYELEPSKFQLALTDQPLVLSYHEGATFVFMAPFIIEEGEHGEFGPSIYVFKETGDFEWIERSRLPERWADVIEEIRENADPRYLSSLCGKVHRSDTGLFREVTGVNC